MAKRFIRAAFEGIRTIYQNKELTLKVLAKYTKTNDEKILDESYRFSVDALSKEGFMPPEAFTALVDQMVSQKSDRRSRGQKTPAHRLLRQSFRNRAGEGGLFQKALAVICNLRFAICQWRSPGAWQAAIPIA